MIPPTTCAAISGPAVFVGGWAVEQLWPFWLAPIVGAALAGVIYVALAGEDKPVATTAVAAAA